MSWQKWQMHLKELLVLLCLSDLHDLHEEVQEITDELKEDTGIYDALGCQVRADFPEFGWWLSDVKMVTGRGTACHTLHALFGMVCSRLSDKKKHIFSFLVKTHLYRKDRWSSSLNLNVDSGQLSPCDHDAGPTHLSLQVYVGLHSRSSSEIRSHLILQKKYQTFGKSNKTAFCDKLWNFQGTPFLLWDDVWWVEWAHGTAGHSWLVLKWKHWKTVFFHCLCKSQSEHEKIYCQNLSPKYLKVEKQKVDMDHVDTAELDWVQVVFARARILPRLCHPVNAHIRSRWETMLDRWKNDALGFTYFHDSWGRLLFWGVLGLFWLGFLK